MPSSTTIAFLPTKPVPGVPGAGLCGEMLACVTTSANVSPVPAMCSLKVVMDDTGKGFLDVHKVYQPLDGGSTASLRPKSRPQSASSSTRAQPGSRTAMRAASRRNADQRYASPQTPSTPTNKNRRAPSPHQDLSPSIRDNTTPLVCSVPLPLRLPPSPLTGSSVMIPMKVDESCSLVLVFQKQDTLVRFVTLMEVIRAKATGGGALLSSPPRQVGVPIRRAARSVVDSSPTQGEEGCPALPTDRIIASPIARGPSHGSAASMSIHQHHAHPYHHHQQQHNISAVRGSSSRPGTDLNTTPLEYHYSPQPHTQSSQYVPPPVTSVSAAPPAADSPYIYMAQKLREKSAHSQAKFDTTLDSYRRTEERRRREINQLFEERDRRRAEFLSKRNILRDDLMIPTYTNHHYPDAPPMVEDYPTTGGADSPHQQWRSFAAMSDAVGRKWERGTVDVEKLIMKEAGRGGGKDLGEDQAVVDYYSQVMKVDLDTISSRPREQEDPMAALLKRIEGDSIAYNQHRSYSNRPAAYSYDRRDSAQPPTPQQNLSRSPTPPPPVLVESVPIQVQEPDKPDPQLAAALEAEARLLSAMSLDPLPRAVIEDVSPQPSSPTPTVVPQPASPVTTVAPLGDIPIGWKEMKDPKSGRAYYYRSSDKKTVWSLDEAKKLSLENVAPTTVTVTPTIEVPAGWKEMKDPKTGRAYYYRASDKKTVWSLDEAKKLNEASDSSTPAVAVSDIPAGWKEMKDPKSGRAYYYRASDKKTVWSLEDVKKLSVEPAATEVPAGWKEMKDPKTGRAYYYRPSDKKTVWSLDEAKKL